MMQGKIKIRWGLFLILASFGLLGVVHTVAVPLFEAPDELWHFSFIQTLATERALPVQSTEGKDMWLREAGQPPLYYIVNAPVVALLDTSDFPDFVRFNVAHPAVTAGSQSEAPNVFIHTPYERFPYRGGVLAVHVVRLLTVLWGVGTVAGAYFIAREIVPDRPHMALMAAALTAFNPHFVYISSVVNNDATAACLCTFVLWLAVRVSKGRGSWKQDLALGFALGLALLSKMSALTLPALVVLALALAWWRERDFRTILSRGLTIFGPMALVGTWWYVRNWILYGDPLGWSVWLIDIAVVRIGLVELVRQFGHVATSYWSPYDGLFPSPVFWALGGLAAVVTMGWIRLILQRDTRRPIDLGGLLLVGTWFIILFASLIKYMLTTPSDEGRLLFPGIAAFSLLIVLGLDAMIPDRSTRPVMFAVGVGLLAFSIASPIFAIAPRYALPLVDSADGLVDETFDGARFGDIDLLGMKVSPEEARPSDVVEVALYWKTYDAPPGDLRAVVQLWTVGGRMVGQSDAIPAGEIYPPDLWRAGDVVRDVRRLSVRTEEKAAAMCRVAVRVMEGEQVLGEVSSSATLRLTGEPVSVDQIAHPLTYTLGRKIELIGYAVSGTQSVSGEPLTVTLYWRSLKRMEEDYTVFVHLIGADGTRISQGDGPPLNNDYPTSHWLPGEVLSDPHVVPVEECPSTGAYLLVGLYRLSDGFRLPVHDATGKRAPNDAVTLDIR